MITYNDIYEAARNERYSDQLQKLSKKFLKDFSKYLEEKKKIIEKEEDSLSDSVIKTKKQLENAKTLFRELLLRRRKKILNLVLVASETGISRQDYDCFLDFERTLFEELLECIKKSDNVIDEKLNGKDKDDSKNLMVVFKEPVEQFAGLNGETMGGFEKGQIANIPKEIAQILIEDDKAEVVEE